MNVSTTSFVIQTLCDDKGSLDFRSLDEKIRLRCPDVDLRVLLDGGKVAIGAGTEVVVSGGTISPDTVIVAKTQLRLCQEKPCPEGCGGLHLCRYYVCGGCTYGTKCKNTHSLHYPHNAGILKTSGLNNFTEKQLFQLLLQNDPSLLPEICRHYNKGKDSCKHGTSCTKLHVCQHHMQGDCKFGSKCMRNHNVNAVGTKVLHGLSQETIMSLPEIYRNKCIIMGQCAAAVPGPDVKIQSQQPSQSNLVPAISEADREEICLFFIRTKCSFKEKCVRVHWRLPYRWQYSEGGTWKDLPKMDDIEKAYCEPVHDTSGGSAISGILGLLTLKSSVSPAGKTVDFRVMKCEGSPVRRLSTASTVSKPPYFILTTQWLWYWKDDYGIWNEFGQADMDASVTSETLENLYLADRDATIPFSAGRQKYVIHFTGKPGTPPMYQENIKFKTRREVRRRPRFASAQDVAEKLASASSPSSTSSSSSSLAKCVPSYWDKTALHEFQYKLVLLPNSANDYTMIEKLFKRTMPKSRINSIQRIQNPSLWKHFQWQKEKMMQKNEGRTVDQRYLFHGTNESLIEAICEQNFDWRMCGLNGVAYGKGSYFARDASYSDRYVGATKSRSRIMFVALVLVGEYCRGESRFVRPPPKGESQTALYDSCVNSQQDPSIFVVFEKDQIYPEYLIDYA